MSDKTYDTNYTHTRSNIKILCNVNIQNLLDTHIYIYVSNTDW